MTVTTTGAVAASPHRLASDAGIAIMRAGGNAVDAAVAVNAVVGVVRPTDCGVGGDLFALVHAPGMPAPAVLNASGRAGSGADADSLRNRGFAAMPAKHPAAVTVPGCVDGWLALLDRYGTCSLAEVLAPAIEIAESGFPTSPEMALNLAAISDLTAGQGSAGELFPDGRSPRSGSPMVRPAYAATLAAIADRGRDAMYGGPLADAITRATGGWITAGDLAANQADWVSGVSLDVFGVTAWTVPPNSQGYITLATLAMLAALEPPADPADPEFHHVLVESYRAAAWDRSLHLADPDRMPAVDLLHPLRLAERAAAIHETAADWPAPDPLPGGTAYMCTVDEAGMGVSLMQSNFGGIGSGISAGATGVWLHNRGAGFSLVGGHPNELAPGRRPAHTLAPTLWTRDGELAMLLGSRGGDLQPQLVAQLATALLYVGLSPGEGQALPRWALDAFGPGEPSAPAVEDFMPEPVIAGLRHRGHRVRVVPRQRNWGPAAVISVGEDGVRLGAADPRVSTAAVATGG